MHAWRRLASAVAVIALLGAGCTANGREPEVVDGEEALVFHVVDGDTFDVEFPGGTTERVRAAQIDTPEMDECGYAESAATLEELILGETVRLVPTAAGPDRDGNGRLLRASELDGDDVGQLIVQGGFARWEPWYADEDPRLASMYELAERQARDEGAGLWSSCRWSSADRDERTYLLAVGSSSA